MGLVLTIVVSALSGALGAFVVVWLLFRRRGEAMPSAYLLPDQLRPLSTFARRLVDHVFPGWVITTGEIRGDKQAFSTAPLGDGDSFTCYYHEFISPERTSSIAILITRGEADPKLEDVNAPISGILRDDQTGHYVVYTPGAIDGIKAETNLMIVPQFPKGIAVFPSAHIVDWIGERREIVFKLAAGKKHSDEPIEINFRVLAGPIVRADINLSLTVRVSGGPESSTRKKVRPYGNVFVCYAHDDTDIVLRYIKRHKSLATYLRDDDFLDPGEEWQPAIFKKISECDKFQLFWSRKSMRSVDVRSEWEFAFGLNRERFVIPTFWERPFPADKDCMLPPPELSALHFQYISVKPSRKWWPLAIVSVLALFMPKTVKAATAAIFAGVVSMTTVSGILIHNHIVRPDSQENRGSAIRADNGIPVTPAPDRLPTRPSPPPLISESPLETTDPVILKDQTVYGQVLNERGKPVSDATVGLTGSADLVKTNSEGRFELDMSQMAPELRSQTKVSITLKANGLEKTVQVQTPGKLNFRIMPNGSVNSEFLWLPAFLFYQHSDASCTDHKCEIHLTFQNTGGPAKSVRALLTVPELIDVDEIKLVRKDASANLVEPARKYYLRRRTKKTRDLIVDLGDVSFDMQSKDFAMGLYLHFHIDGRKQQDVDARTLKVNGRVLSFIDVNGVRQKPVTPNVSVNIRFLDGAGRRSNSRKKR